MNPETKNYLRYLQTMGVEELPIQTSSKPSKKARPPEKRLTLEQIRSQLGDGCGSELCKTRSNLVFGEGDSKANLVFVGEGPGADEDAQGRPFVGRAGQLLTRIVEAIGLKREQVYICNVIKCRPPNNRTPLPEEIRLCSPFLQMQLEAIRPKVIVTLGNIATQFLLQTTAGISKLRNQFHDYQGMAVMPTYHPAYLLRNPPAKRQVWEDMQKVRDFLGLPKTR
ncbi:MAG: uracil-DNA glycosylase [Deltaproteobacteria bacterium]|nr:uracil-DNA glycosylase [Deltaproteobacteria bacterium]